MRSAPKPVTAQWVEALEQRSRQAASVNLILLVVVPFVVFVAVVDGLLWGMHARKPLVAVTPNLEEIDRPLPSMPSVTLEGTLFQPIQPVKPAAQSTAAGPEVGSQEIPWKLKGVLKGDTLRAFLEDASGQTVWVTQSEQLGPFKVIDIKERSVVLEADGKSYEIRM